MPAPRRTPCACLRNQLVGTFPGFGFATVQAFLDRLFQLGQFPGAQGFLFGDELHAVQQQVVDAGIAAGRHQFLRDSFGVGVEDIFRGHDRAPERPCNNRIGVLARQGGRVYLGYFLPTRFPLSCRRNMAPEGHGGR